MQGTKIFIGSLGNRAHPGDLRRLFEDYGTVTACDIVNRCGFVHMETEEQAKRAIQKLDKSTFNGQTISVEWGRQRQQGGDRGSGRSFGERRGRSNYDSDSRRRTSHRSRSRSRSRSPRRHRKHSEDSRGRGRSDSRRDRNDSDRRRSDRDRERDRSRNRSPERRRSYDKRR